MQLKERPYYSVHGGNGFFIEPFMDLLKIIICYIFSTRDTHTFNTVQFFPYNTQMLETLSMDQLAVVMEDRITIL